MINNKYYYKVTGTINADTGIVITNPVIKFGLTGIESSQETGFYSCEYEVYNSETDYLNGFYFQKAWDTVEGKRIKNFTAPYDPELSGLNAAEKQEEILANQFGWSVDDIELVVESE
jgi:hypothetical protein